MTLAPQEHLQRTKDALVATTRALAKDSTIQVAFGSVHAGADLVLPEPEHTGVTSQLTQIRATADNFALTHRLHDSQIHQARRPAAADKARLFDVLEQIRIETAGSEYYEGVAYNLSQRLHQKIKASIQQDGPLPLLLKLEIQARRILQPHIARYIPVADIPTAHTTALAELSGHMHNQLHYAKRSLQLIDQMIADTPPVDEPGEGSNYKPVEDTTNSDLPDAAQQQSFGGSAQESADSTSPSLLEAAGMAMAPAGHQVHVPAAQQASRYPFNRPQSAESAI
ncbi:MAG: hypothetical protein AB7L92_09395, partial [Alphaproteobacteria bacterium]